MTSTEIFFVFVLANVISVLIWLRWQRESILEKRQIGECSEAGKLPTRNSASDTVVENTTDSPKADAHC